MDNQDKRHLNSRGHLNGIEGVFLYPKHFLCPYEGVPKQYFRLYLKETEWRFNHKCQGLREIARHLMVATLKGYNVVALRSVLTDQAFECRLLRDTL